jgi:uncharacterized protein YegP (UPF0339 family)
LALLAVQEPLGGGTKECCMNAKFELERNAGGEFIFRLKAPNGQNILRSESYVKKSSAENGIESVKKNSLVVGRYQKLVAKNGQFYFNLTAVNHHVIGTSETYTTEKSRDAGIDSVKTNASGAEIVDKSIRPK